MSKQEKLLARIDKLDSSLTFKDLEKVLIGIGYVGTFPRGGSSHCTFRKKNCNPITIPKTKPINKAYIILVKEILREVSFND